MIHSFQCAATACSCTSLEFSPCLFSFSALWHYFYHLRSCDSLLSVCRNCVLVLYHSLLCGEGSAQTTVLPDGCDVVAASHKSMKDAERPQFWNNSVWLVHGVQCPKTTQVMRDAVMEGSGNFDHLEFFNMHRHRSTLASSISSSKRDRSGQDQTHVFQVAT